MTQPNAGFRWPQLVAAPSSQAAVEGAPPDLTTATVARRAIAPLSMHERIVAIVAPVGYGKTTLMGGWFRACKDADPVWVGLDASWRDQVFFVRSLLNAIGGPSEPVAMGAIDAAAVVESGLLALLQALGQRRRPMMLFAPLCQVFVRQWPAGPQDQDPFHYGAAQTVLAYAHKCN